MDDAIPLLPVILQSVLVFQIVYITLQWYYIRKTEYLYYIGYMVTISLYIMLQYEERLHIRFFSAVYENPIMFLNKSLPILGYFLYYRFARYFVDMKTVFPGLNKWVKGLEYLLLAYIVFETVVAIIQPGTLLSQRTFEGISLILFLSTFVFLFAFLKKKIRVTYYLLAGALVLDLGSFGSMLLLTQQENGARYLCDPFWPFAAATIFDLLAFTTGLAYKSKQAVKNSLDTEMAYNRELQQNMLLGQKMFDIKENLATRLHSDLINALGNMGSYARLAKKEIQAESTDRSLLYINKIIHAGKYEVERINDLIWSISPGNTRVENLKEKLLAVWNEYEDSSLPLLLEIEKHAPDVEPDTTVLLGIIHMVRGMRETLADTSKPLYSLKIRCLDGFWELHVDLKNNKDNAFFVACFGPYLKSVEQMHHTQTIRITTIRD